MISRAREREIDLEHIGKRKAEHVQTSGGSAKKSKVFDARSRGQQGRCRLASVIGCIIGFVGGWFGLL